MRRLSRPYRAQQRHMDLTMLWPVITDVTDSMDHAKSAFACHAFNDPAWTIDLCDSEIYVIIDALDTGGPPEWKLRCPKCGTRDSLCSPEPPRNMPCSAECGATMRLDLPQLKP